MTIDLALPLVDELNDRYLSAVEADQRALARAVLDEAIGLLDGVLPGTYPGHPLFPHAALIAARAYELRWLADGPPADLDAAISHARGGLRGLQARPAGGDEETAEQADLSRLLGFLLARRFSEAGPDPADPQAVAAARRDRDEAIVLLAEARQPAVAEDPDELDVCLFLGHLYHERHCDRWPDPAVDDEDLASAIALLTVLARQPEPDRVDVAALVTAWSGRWVQTGTAQDRDDFIRWGQVLLGMPDPEEPVNTGLLDLLAMALIERAEGTEGSPAALADLDSAITCLEAEMADTPSDDEYWSDLVAALARAYCGRLEGNPLDSADFDRKLEYARRAWALPVPDPEVRAYRDMAGLRAAMEIYSRFGEPGQSFDLNLADLAIRMLIAAEQNELTREAGQHPVVVTMLATYHASWAQMTGSAAALREARHWVWQACREVSLDDPEHEFLIQFLSRALAVLVTKDTMAADLDQAIAVLRVAASRPVGDPRDDARTHSALGFTLVYKAQLTGQLGELDYGIGELLKSWELLPEHDLERGPVACYLSSALMVRYQQHGDAQDLDAAEYYQSAAQALGGALTGLMPDAEVVVAGTRGMYRIVRGASSQDVLVIDDGIADIRAVLAGIEPGHAYYARLQSDLGVGLICRAAFGPDPARDTGESVKLLRAVLEAAVPDDVTRPLMYIRLSGALGVGGWRLQDPQYLRQAAACLAAARAEFRPDFGHQERFILGSGYVYRLLYRLTQSQWDLDGAIRWLRESRRELSRRPGHPLLGSCLMELAHCYHGQPDPARALEAGRAGLRERSRDVLLQTGTARGLGLAQVAAAEALEVTQWCLAEGDAEAAVETLELGRGLILHSAIAVTSAADTLIDIGQHHLAAEWQAAPSSAQPAPWDSPGPLGNPLDLFGGSGTPEIPADLRARVLNALTQTGANPLLTPPNCAEIAEALTGTGADALVYLLEPAGNGPGHAVIVPAEALRGPRSAAEIVLLPLLHPGRSGPLTRYTQADEASGLTGEPDASGAGRPVGPEELRGRWSEALDQLCDWAGSAVMAPLLGHMGQWGLDRPPRLVLVPAGRLSLVPWHAARLDPAGSGKRGGDYACARAVISYAASGRQLVEVSKRPALALEADPVVVGDPAADLVFGAIEAHFIRACCYPGGRYLGRPVPLAGAVTDGPGRPDEVLRELPSATAPGASVLHLGCHGQLAADAPGQSYLGLADGQQLAIETILRQAGQRPAASPGGLVCLAACSSAHGGAVHDEALSLSTAFLAAGATSVIGARWNVVSGVTSVLMFMLHWFLALDGQSPRDALRSAQLWLLDPDRAVPAQLPDQLARFLPDPAGLAVADWAAFAHHGR